MKERGEATGGGLAESWQVTGPSPTEVKSRRRRLSRKLTRYARTEGSARSLPSVDLAGFSHEMFKVHTVFYIVRVGVRF
jgi:hypothetical protein